MNYQLVIDEQAEQDIEELMRWYEQQQIGLGGRFIDDLQKSLDVMTKMPKLSAVVYKNARRVILNKFPIVIHFLLTDNSVQVFSVMHGRGNPKHWQNRM